MNRATLGRWFAELAWLEEESRSSLSNVGYEK